MACDILFGNENSYGPQDSRGCHMPRNHGGKPHEFVAADGHTYQWETDIMCECDHCMKCEGDYCMTYWEKAGE